MTEVIKVIKCPTCNKLEPKGKYSPFCSKRCADVDLGKWFNESYVIETNEKPSSDNLENQAEKS